MARAKFGSTIIPSNLMHEMQTGIMAWSYRGRPTWKCPLDLATYSSILWDVKPKTIVEFGSNRGGSALWFADQMTAFGIEQPRVYSLDINPVTDLEDPRIVFGYCDVAEPEKCINIDDLKALPKPLLVVDDASHMSDHVLAVLRFVDKAMATGDYLIVEDGSLNHLGWEKQYRGGPLRAIKTFLKEAGGRYEIDRERCDFYGRNATWNPEGYIRCIR